MNDHRKERRLMAVMAADVVGYSRLVRADEESTIQRFKDLKTELFDPKLTQHRGRIVKLMGDGLLVEFASVVDAVRAASQIQAEVIQHNDKWSADKKMFLRIGINVGDVVIDGDDIHGDGVNVAARLEALAPPGGIYISDGAYEQVRDRLDLPFTDLGEQELKNIDRPVHVYAVGDVFKATKVSQSAQDVKKQISQLDMAQKSRPSIFRYASYGVVSLGILIGAGFYWKSAFSDVDQVTSMDASEQQAVVSIMVLPFTNDTGDPEQDYIADGLTVSVTSDLSRIRDAFVAAARTAFAYKNKPITLEQLGSDEGVRFVLQGNVQRGGDKIRINAQLADTQSGEQLWAETFEGDQANLFVLQDLVTARIGNSIGREMVILAARENETIVNDPKAADLILRAQAATLKPQSLENWQQIEKWFRQALELEAENTTALHGLSRSLVVQAFNFGYKLDPDIKEQKFTEGRDYALKAKELDPNNPMIYGALALYYSTHNDFPAQKRAVETWLSLDPKNPMAYNFEANSQIYLGNYKKSIELLDQGSALDPKHPNPLLAVSYFRAYFLLGDDDSAIEWAQRALELNSRFSEAYVFLAMAYARKGDEIKAEEAVKKLFIANPKFKLTNFRKPQSSRPDAHNEAYSEILLPAGRNAGLPE